MVFRWNTWDDKRWHSAWLSVFVCDCVVRWDEIRDCLCLCYCMCVVLRVSEGYIAAFQVTRRPVYNNWCFLNPSPLFCPPLTAANLSYRVTSFSPSLPEALRTSYQSHSVPHSDTPSLAKACTPPDSYLLLSFPLCQSSEPTLVSGLIGDPHRTDVRAIIHLKLQFFLLVLQTPICTPHPELP